MAWTRRFSLKVGLLLSMTEKFCLKLQSVELQCHSDDLLTHYLDPKLPQENHQALIPTKSFSDHRVVERAVNYMEGPAEGISAMGGEVDDVGDGSSVGFFLALPEMEGKEVCDNNTTVYY